jgi:hypothetical protein
MLTSYNQIKQEMLDEYDNLTEDAVHEIADSNCPIYYSEIIAEWQQLPSEYSDTWRDHGHEVTPETTITNLMAIDLYYYYLELANKAFAEISVEREDLELEEA